MLTGMTQSSNEEVFAWLDFFQSKKRVIVIVIPLIKWRVKKRILT
jgi:hypothetical protein